MKLYEYKIRREFLREEPTTQVTNPKDAYRYLMSNCYHDDDMFREQCYVLYLNQNRNIVGHTLLSMGGTSSTAYDTKIAVKGALDTMATAVILSHNHPSGNAKPSQADINMTKKMKQAFNCFDISLLDHIIVTDGEYYSFSEEQTYKAE